MKIIVFGASGKTGTQFVQLALKEGHFVTAFVRNPEKLTVQGERLRIIKGDALDKETAENAAAGHDAAVSCLGANGLGKTTDLSHMAENITAALLKHNVKRIAYVASAGIYNEIPGARGKMAMFILRNVLEDHKRAADILSNSGLDWTIARPMRLDDGPMTKKYRKALEGVPEGGQRITRSDTAHFLLNALLDNEYINCSVGLAY
ncbi:SDR family oxidoreductase [Metabacillus sp. GX 13764]|uniref:NAD(P)-dependent oxidoreductase n=1 Tax=Metabacillus kandeliae TaxID=2900151 RepID=UPI001E63F88C|nr:NAD(P)-binding oxidoreductase [Metabacillus kandeliae]MCD7034771.1 SDR family oxidoreductase [Metabacillus kandeliae]